MRWGNFEVKRRVWVGLLFAVTGIGVWLVWSKAMKPRPAGGLKATQAFVRLAGWGVSLGDQVLRERAVYFDPTPLFFPTEWNYGQNRLKESARREPEQIFGSFDPKLNYGEQDFKAFTSDTVVPPEQLVDVLSQGNERPLGGLGRIDRIRPALSSRSGFLEVSDLSDGKLIMAQSFMNANFPHSDYKPAEFLAVVASDGLVGELTLVSGSGWDDLDAFLQTYLVGTFRVGERLAPGRYRLVVGP